MTSVVPASIGGRSFDREQLISNHLGLAISLASRMCHNRNEHDDVQQVALMALVKAADRFDFDNGTAFSTFAWQTIAGEIKRYYRDQASTLHVSRGLRELSLVVRNAIDELTNSLGRAPTNIEIAVHSGCTVEQVLESIELLRNGRPDSLDALNEENSTQVSSVDRATKDVDGEMWMESMLAPLPERQRQAVRLRFIEQMSQSEIGEQLGVSQMHVSRLLAKGLATLRELASRSY